MQAELVAFTQANPALDAGPAERGDLATLRQGKGTDAENLIEYAGRLCYRSTQRMGTAGDFIADRVREGHEDIIEHVIATVRLHCAAEDAGEAATHPPAWRLQNRHCEVSGLGGGEWLVSGNTRVWLDLFRQGLALAALPLVRGVAPAVFAGLPGAPAQGVGATPEEAGSGEAARGGGAAWSVGVGKEAVGEGEGSAGERARQGEEGPEWEALLPREDGTMRVTLLGYTRPLIGDTALLRDHGAATFLFEGISRTCTHQLVRHRLASFSQESQRYVDLSKGEWRAITPPAIAANPQALAELEEFWQLAEAKYARLRQLGVRKEDARFLLPNAAETRIIATMNFAAWGHFLWLRAVDKAAQWEIRLMGQRALEMLHAIAPVVFAEQWRVYQEQFAGGSTVNQE